MTFLSAPASCTNLVKRVRDAVSVEMRAMLGTMELSSFYVLTLELMVGDPIN